MACTNKIQFITGHLPPWTNIIQPEQGEFYQVMFPISKKLNSKIHFLPWDEAQDFAKSQCNTFIFPFAKLKPRTKDFNFFQKIGYVELGVLSLTSLKSIDSLKHEKILVVKKSPADYSLIQKGFKNIIRESSVSKTHIDMLLSNEVKAIFATEDYYRHINGKEKGIHYLKYQSNIPIFLATSKSTPQESIKKVIKLLQTSKKNNLN